MFLSVCDIFKIGIGPSSSHTMGPMTAAACFLDSLKEAGLQDGAALHLKVRLHGSLAFTGKGHATDRAVILGLCGLIPDSLNPDEAEALEARVYESATVVPPGFAPLHFDPQTDLVFDYGPPLPGHANGLVMQALDDAGTLRLERTYYSVGGGFVLTEEELQALGNGEEMASGEEENQPGYPYPFETAQQMLQMAADAGLTIAEMKRVNELACHHDRLDEKLDAIWQAMDSCIERGLRMDGILPGGLKVRRRAKAIYGQLTAERGRNIDQPHVVNDWLSVYAMAVNEENAAGARVVTSPTNGAAGVVPAVVRYYRDHCIGGNHQGIRDFLLTAAAIGGLIKHNASISGAEVGCQGEVGSASAMAAAGLCAALGGTNEQIENAAEIALEHHLGMTCDPAAGLVQVPCIERNALGAIKAVSAASLSLRGDGRHFMPLDNCIKVMMQTGQDMNEKYKETSTGGIAVNLAEC
ncbi:L-serine ammonia-lyase [Fodinicurvata fenggangensis]|uniref:L-serine ammonia-lyase n=1 Tax=Fodinicurvata fenggangensis TaxID=1121830 RepID=UPI00047CFDC1|nr:L-serine ammonia-lyase [Fodinicurvata fenggangensis]